MPPKFLIFVYFPVSHKLHLKENLFKYINCTPHAKTEFSALVIEQVTEYSQKAQRGIEKRALQISTAVKLEKWVSKLNMLPLLKIWMEKDMEQFLLSVKSLVNHSLEAQDGSCMSHPTYMYLWSGAGCAFWVVLNCSTVTKCKV